MFKSIFFAILLTFSISQAFAKSKNIEIVCRDGNVKLNMSSDLSEDEISSLQLEVYDLKNKAIVNYTFSNLKFFYNSSQPTLAMEVGDDSKAASVQMLVKDIPGPKAKSFNELPYGTFPAETVFASEYYNDKGEYVFIHSEDEFTNCTVVVF